MSKDYRDTLNLPQTDLSMKAGLAKKEPELLSYWDSIDLYSKIREQNKGKKQFILHDGPPYANGDIHLGHAVNKVLKDITIKVSKPSRKRCALRSWLGLPWSANRTKY